MVFEMVSMLYNSPDPETHGCILAELIHVQRTGHRILYKSAQDSGSIDRNRSIVCSQFLMQYKDCEAIIMIDHDMVWRVGDVCAIVEQCIEHKAIYSALYSRRKIGAGYTSTSSLSDDGRFMINLQDPRRYVEADRLAGGFMAIPRSALSTMAAGLDIDSSSHIRGEMKRSCAKGDIGEVYRLSQLAIGLCKGNADTGIFYDLFRPMRQSRKDGTMDYYGEDYAFCMRAQYCGIPLRLSLLPTLAHRGTHGFTIEDGRVRHHEVDINKGVGERGKTLAE